MDRGRVFRQARSPRLIAWLGKAGTGGGVNGAVVVDDDGVVLLLFALFVLLLPLLLLLLLPLLLLLLGRLSVRDGGVGICGMLITFVHSQLCDFILIY